MTEILVGIIGVGFFIGGSVSLSIMLAADQIAKAIEGSKSTKTDPTPRSFEGIVRPHGPEDYQ